MIDRIRHYPIRRNFRADFAYQNVMYLVAGQLIEAVTDTSWDDFIKERIFTPLKMDASSTSIGQLLLDRHAHLHLSGNVIPLLNIDNIAPAGAINSNVDDMLR